MKTFKRALCIFLIVVMCLTSAPLQGFVGLEWPSLPEINFGEFELPKIDFCSLFSSKASAATEGYYTYTVTNGKATITRVNTSISGDITIPATLGGYSVTTIGDDAFYCCDSLTSVTIPDSVITIGELAFAYCDSLTSVTIGDSVTTIGDYAFYDCYSLTSIVVDADNPAYSSDSRGALFDKNKTILIQYPIGNTNSSYSITNSVTTIGDDAFESCYSLTSITIPDSVTTIGDDAFEYCYRLTSITIPDSVTTIGDYAFNSCDSLTSITIGDGVTTIGDYAFEYCYSLTSITIGDSVTTIGVGAFYCCDSLTSVTIGDSVTTIGDGAFADCYSLTSIVVDADNPAYSSDSRGALFDKNKTILIQYPISNTNSSYSITNSVTTIGDYALAYCYSLTSITIGDSVTTIGDYALAYCYSLTSITIPDSVTTIGVGAFNSCNSLTSVTIGDSVTTIGDRAFYSCDSLTSVTIGDSVTTIGDYAFADCDSLTDVYYNGTEEQWKKITIGSANECLTNATIHYNSSGAEVTTGYKREHVVDNWKTLNQSYKSEYLVGFAVPMDGTNGNPDYLIPGQSENMIPQGLTYWPEKDWVLVSSYDVNEKNASVIFALDRETGAFVAQFNLYTKDGKAWKCHAGGIGVSDNNLYITSGNGVGYFSLSDLDVKSGTVKDITREGHVDFAQLGKTNTAYVNVSDGILWAGNFYSASPGSEELAELGAIPKSWTWKANEDYYSAILGFKLSGNTSEEEWNNLVAIKDDASHVININNSIDCIQGITFKKLDDNRYTMYLSRTTDASFGASISTAVVSLDSKIVEVNNIKRFTLNKNLPGTEGIVLIGDELHILYESAALSKSGKIGNEIIWNQHLKDCTDVIWKINESNLLCTPTFDSDSFKNDSNEYNHKLAKFCSSFICVGYNYKNIEWISDTLIDAGMNADKEFIDTNVGQNGVNNIISHKKINVNGKVYTLIFVAAIGSYKKQWYSNFDPGTSTTHRGFIYAKNHVNLQLAKYIQKYNLHDVENTKILLTGHSRGAATVNLLAAELIKNQNLAQAENIYTYGFATPNTTSLPERNEEKFERIFNIVNPEDFVTKVVPTKWDYGRYGTTYTLPSKFNSGRGYVDGEYVNLYSEYFLPKMKKVFLQMQKEEYEPYPVGEATVYGLMKKLTDEVTNLNNYYSKEFRLDYRNKMTPYYLFQSVLCPIVAKDDEDAEKLAYAWASDILTMPGSSDLYQDIIEFFVVNQGVSPKFEHSHLMETYYSYVMTMTEDEITETRKPYAYKENTVNCPVDIEVYDIDAKEVVGRIVNNTIDEEVAKGDFGIYMEVNGDSKMFHLPDCGNYIVKLTGNDVGTMDYTISEINSDFEEVKRINFFDVEITDGLTMTADVEGEDFVIEEHELIFEDGETLEPTEIFTEKDIETYNINISASEGGSASSSQTAKSGDYVSLDAIVEEGWKFAGWYENDELISTETTLAFVAKSDRNLEAKFEHIDHSFNNWYEVTPATCETSGTEQRDCSACDYSETQEIPATGHDFDGSECKNCDYDKADTCGCNCHKGGIAGFFFKLILFFQKIFKTNQICEGCGIKHY